MLTKWVSDFATTITTFFNAQGTSSWGYWLLYFLMVVTFTYFYTTVLFDQQNYGDNLKRSGAQIRSTSTTQVYYLPPLAVFSG